jgi:DNA end-binding protein Ku
LPEREELENEDAEVGAVRSFWSGTISFGLVSVPVELFPAVHSRGVSLRMLDDDGTPLARRYFCPEEDVEIGGDEIVRGFEIEKDEYVVVTDEELESLEPEKSRDIDLRLFVDADAIDPLYFERPYFLVPAGDSTKAYRLLAAIMERTHKAGIATFVMRDKEYLIAIFAEKGILRAETLRFQDELRSAEDVGLEGVSDVEKDAVRKLEREIEKLTRQKLDLEELRDDFAERLIEHVSEKHKARADVVVSGEVEAEEPEETVIDLMELLKSRLRETKEAPASERSAGSRKNAGKRKDSDDLEEQSKEELYERAKELGIEGRSGMSKSELIKAIRKSA